MKTETPTRRRTQKKIWPRRLVLYTVSAVLLVPFVIPLWWLVTTSLKSDNEVFAVPPSILPKEWMWSNYVEAFTIRPLAQQYFNSVYIAVAVTVLTIAVSALAGYAFARIKFPGRNIIFVVLLSALLLPEEVTIIPLYRLVLAFGWIDTHIPLIVIPVFGAGSVVGTFLMRQYFLGLPEELEDAGRIDGLGRLGIFWHIALPLARPAVAALAILAFLGSWNAFLEPLIFIRDRNLFTLPVALSTYVDTYAEPLWTVQFAATTLTVLPIAIVFMLAQRHFIAGLTQGGLK